MSDSELYASVLARLRHAVQRLAQPGAVQLALLPDFVSKGDELALDFFHWRETALSQSPHGFSPEQQEALAGLDGLLAAMWGQTREALWTDAAVQGAPEWEQVRSRAREALAAFGWPDEAPPSYAHEYVAPPGEYP